MTLIIIINWSWRGKNLVNNKVCIFVTLRDLQGIWYGYPLLSKIKVIKTAWWPLNWMQPSKGRMQRQEWRNGELCITLRTATAVGSEWRKEINHYFLPLLYIGKVWISFSTILFLRATADESSSGLHSDALMCFLLSLSFVSCQNI